ncbi:hypothetical protein BD309DRAFT_958908 [Dichomitus squalens]|nr:hypothetical protein BD309DRAFT_958908 [Dichomitus squalens]
MLLCPPLCFPSAQSQTWHALFLHFCTHLGELSVPCNLVRPLLLDVWFIFSFSSNVLPLTAT